MKNRTKKPLGTCCIIAILLSLFCVSVLVSQNVKAQAPVVSVGQAPKDVAITPDGQYAYVTSASGKISVINTSTNIVTATINVGGYPNYVAIMPNDEYAYVTNVESSSVSVINTSSNTVTATVHLNGEAAGLAITPDGANVYVANGGSVSVINTTTNSVTTTITVGSYPLGVAITPDGQYAYVAIYADGTISVISTTTNSVATTIKLPFGSKPVDIAVTPDNQFAYVTDQSNGRVFVISTLSQTVMTKVSGLSNPFSVTLSPKGDFAYVTNDGTNSLSMIDTSTNIVTGSRITGGSPGGLAVTPDSKFIYVANHDSASVSVIDASLLTAGVMPTSETTDIGQSTSFSAIAFGGSNSYTSYQWYVNGSIQNSQKSETFSFTPSFAGYYLITTTVTDSSGATSPQSDASIISVNPSPTVSINPAGPLSLPIGIVQEFTAKINGGTGIIAYQWYLDNSAVGTDSASYTYVSTSGSHNITCTVTDSALVPVTSPNSNSVSITALPRTSSSNATSNSWIENVAIQSMSPGDQAVVINGIVYVFGHNDYCYNASTDSWNTTSPMLTLRNSFAVAAYGNKAYVIGGYEGDSQVPCSINEVYNPSTNAWTTAATMPTNRSEMAAQTVGGKIYVLGGRGINSFSTGKNEIYDPATNSWSTGASMPYPVASAASAPLNNSIYVIGGSDDSHPPAESQNVPGVNSVNFNQAYDTLTNSWTLKAPIPTSTLAAGAGATTGVNAPQRIYVFGNIIGFLESSNQTYAYDPASNSWNTIAPMPYPCSSPAIAVLNDLLFVFGDGQNVEQYTPIAYMPTTTGQIKTPPTPELPFILILPLLISLSYVAMLLRRRIVVKKV